MAPRPTSADSQAILANYYAMNFAEAALKEEQNEGSRIIAQIEELQKKLLASNGRAQAKGLDLQSKTSAFDGACQNYLGHFQRVLNKEKPAPFEIATICQRELVAVIPQIVKANHDRVLEYLEREVDVMADNIISAARDNGAYFADWGLEKQQSVAEQNEKITQQLRSPFLINETAVRRYLDRYKEGHWYAEHYIKSAKLCGYSLVLGGPEGRDVISLNITEHNPHVTKADHAQILAQFGEERISQFAYEIWLHAFTIINREKGEKNIKQWLESPRLPDPDYVKDLIKEFQMCCRIQTDISTLCGYEVEIGHGNTVLSIKPRLTKEA